MGSYLFFNRLIFGKWHLCLVFVFPVSRGLPQKQKSEYQGKEASAGRKDLVGVLSWKFSLTNMIFLI